MGIVYKPVADYCKTKNKEVTVEYEFHDDEKSSGEKYIASPLRYRCSGRGCFNARCIASGVLSGKDKLWETE